MLAPPILSIETVAERISRLSESKKRLVSCIVAGKDNSEIAEELSFADSLLAQTEETVPDREPPLDTPADAASAEQTDVPPKAKEAVVPEDEVTQYGSGLPVTLDDPASITDVAVTVLEHESGEVASQMLLRKKQGFLPEIVIVYPPGSSGHTMSQVIFVKRQ